MSSGGEHLPVPVSPRASDDPAASSVLVEAGGRTVRGELRRVPGMRARYALTLSNDSPFYLLVSFRVRRGGSDRPIPPGEIWMDPRSHADLAFTISPLAAMRGGWVIVRLINAQIRHELVAPLPGPAALFGAFAGAGLAAACAFAVAFAHPRIEVFAVPSVAAANATLRVPYRTSGIGSAWYALEDDGGRVLASGKLRDASGTLALSLPASGQARSYTVRIRDVGALGIAERAEPVMALPSATAAPRPLIEALAVDSAQVSDGGSVTVRYRTAATRGNVTVRDDRNTIWAQAPLSRKGITRLSLPHFGHDESLRVTLDARRGGEHATSTVGVNVAAVANAPAPASVAMPGSAAVVIEDQRVSAGGTIHATIVPGATGVTLTLETRDGSTLAAVNVPDGTPDATIAVPRNAHGEVVLVATYDVGAGQESIVRRFTVP